MAKKTTLKLWTGEIWEDLFPSTHADLIIMGDGQNNLQHLMNEVVNRSDRAYEAAQEVLGQIEQIEQIAKGAQQAVSFGSYKQMVNALNSADSSKYKVGQSIYIQILNVPDVWISDISSSYHYYSYTSDKEIMDALKDGSLIYFGYYGISQLEQGKVNLDFTKVTSNGKTLPTLDIDNYFNIENGTGDGAIKQKSGGKTTASGIGSVALNGGYSPAQSGKAETNGVQALGALSLAAGKDTVAHQICSIALGAKTKAGRTPSEFDEVYPTGEDDWGDTYDKSFGIAIATGLETEARGRNSFAANRGTKAISSDSAAFGVETTSSGVNGSFACGFKSNATAAAAFATNNQTTASGTYSAAFGTKTTASGNAAFACGQDGTASGPYSFTEGERNAATQWGSYAGGFESHSVHQLSFARGRGLWTTAYYQTVVGEYNTKNSSPVCRFVVGVGNSDSDRKDGFKVLKDGRAKLLTGPQDDDDIVIKSYVVDNFDDFVIKSLTENANTLTDEEKAKACEWLGADKKGVLYYPSKWISSTENLLTSASSFNLPPKIGDLVITIDGYLGIVDTFYNNGEACNIKRLTSLKWTEDDKTEIKNSVLEALPFYTGEITVEDDA